jgi:hypothetical protein
MTTCSRTRAAAHRRRPGTGVVEHSRDDAQVESEHVGVVLVACLDRLDRARDDLADVAPDRLPPIGVGSTRVDQDERPFRCSGDVAQHLLGLHVSLLVDREYRGAVVQRPCCENP